MLADAAAGTAIIDRQKGEHNQQTRRVKSSLTQDQSHPETIGALVTRVPANARVQLSVLAAQRTRRFYSALNPVVLWLGAARFPPRRCQG